jgi:hypothetical protein
MTRTPPTPANPLPHTAQGEPLPAPTTPTLTPEHGAALLDQLRAMLTRYVVLPTDEATDAVVLWIAATHAQPCWAHAPRLVIRAPEKRCGKSRLLDVIEATCRCPLITVNASVSAVYRSIGTDDPPTLLIDESDTIFGPKAEGSNEDLRGILNAGHQRNRPTIRYDASRQMVEKIPTFAMAALAGIGAMPDTIEDRAVIIRMRRRAPGETVAPFRHRRDAPQLRTLAAHLSTWLRDNDHDLEAATPAMPVEDRAADTWEPLIAVADLAGGTWPQRARNACLALTADRESADDVPLKVRLLMDCRTAFAHAPALPTGVLLDRLRADPEAPWIDLGPGGLSARRLAQMLRDYDITSSNQRFPESGQAKGYNRLDFTDAWSRYCPETTPAPAAEGYPSHPSQASHRRSTRDGNPTWDGSSVPALLSVPGLTWNDELGTDGTPTPPTCIHCRQPLTYDDGTHTHPGCIEGTG